MFAAAVVYELFIPECHTLKEKRAVVRPIVDGLQRRYRVSSAEVGQLDKWQRSDIGIAVIAGSEAHVLDVLGACDRFVWSFPEIEVLEQRRAWVDPD